MAALQEIRDRLDMLVERRMNRGLTDPERDEYRTLLALEVATLKARQP